MNVKPDEPLLAPGDIEDKVDKEKEERKIKLHAFFTTLQASKAVSDTQEEVKGNPFGTKGSFQSFYNPKSEEYKKLKYFKEEWKEKIIKNDLFYGFENYTTTLKDRILLSLWWTDLIAHEGEQLMKFLEFFEKECAYCKVCAMKNLLDSMSLKFGKKGKTSNPVTFPISEAITISLLHKKPPSLIEYSEGYYLDFFRSIFYATDSHTLCCCLCGSRRDIKEQEIGFIKKQEKFLSGPKEFTKIIESSITKQQPNWIIFPFQSVRTISPPEISFEKEKVTYVQLFNSSFCNRRICTYKRTELKERDKSPTFRQREPDHPLPNLRDSISGLEEDDLRMEEFGRKDKIFFVSEDFLKIVLFEFWLKEVETWRMSLRSQEVENAVVVALNKIKTVIQKVNSDSHLLITESPSKSNSIDWDKVNKLHYQIFSAAGDLKTIVKPTVPEDEFNRQLTDLLFRETICLVAEQVQHCPARINYLYHYYRHKIYNLTDEEISFFFEGSGKEKEDSELTEKIRPPDTPSNYADIFVTRMKSIPKITREQSPTFFHSIKTALCYDLDKIKDGLKEFKDDKLNFDDVNDCGKWESQKLEKTYREPFSMCLLIFIIAKYIPEMLSVKLWFIFTLYIISVSDSPLSINSDLIQQFMAIDVGCMSFFFISSWIIRIATTTFCCPCRCNFTKYLCTTKKTMWALVFRLVLDFVLFAATMGYIGYYIATDKDDKQPYEKILPALESMAVYYTCGRLGVFVAYLFLPMAPLTSTKQTHPSCNVCKLFKMEGIKGIWKRVILRIVFIILFLVSTGFYEYYLIVNKFDTILTPYCGERIFTWKDAFIMFNTQGAICNVSWVSLWVVTVAGLIIDNGLAFTLLMSVFGLALGIKRQGESRALVKVSKQALAEKIFKRFSEHIPHNKQDEQTEAEFKEELFDRVWTWCLNYWRAQDLISNREKNMLNSQVVDVSKLSSGHARETIGFWINSLTIEPINRMAWDDIPKTSVLIPVYEEKLEFTWKDEVIGPKAPYSAIDEARYLIAKYPYHWFNLQERIGDRKNEDRWKRKFKSDDGIYQYHISNWLSMHDQLVYRTVKGAASYYKSLTFLAQLELGIKKKEAKKLAFNKIEIILCFQTYQRFYNDSGKIIQNWLKKFPYMKVVYDFTRQKTMPEEMSNPINVPLPYDFATVCLSWDRINQKIVHQVIPRENPLLLVNTAGERLQGKAMNQLNGMMFLTGQYIQVLDANQGGHATEYLKFPSLLQHFKPSESHAGNPRRRIIGCREYIFTGSLSRVASFHAYQEWSFGTLVLRVYSDLGIRLHYGHPDVFHGAWARAHSGLSKVNPNINTSEDVFAGFETMQCKERTKHLEHIQFEKGRETGLANMSSFDSKISAGNAGLLRSRDFYHLTERLPILKRFLFFYGITGHFLTNTAMVISLYWYIWALFLFSLAGVSIQAIGGTIFSTEWLLHAGLTTVIPLFAELLVERGPTLGVLQAILFVPVSTIVYLFQMQTKHSALTDSFVTGHAVHISTGRGLQIYRRSMATLFSYYAHTHFYSIFEIIALTIAYWSIASELHGGSLPLVMIYVFCVCVVTAPQLFNPTLRGSSLTDNLRDIIHFVSWVGKPSPHMSINDWEKNLKEVTESEADFVRFSAMKDMANLPTSFADALLFTLTQFIFPFGFWILVTIFLLYPSIQFWLANFIVYWFFYLVVAALFGYSAKFSSFQTPALMLVFLVLFGCFVGQVLIFSSNRVPPWANIYIAIFLFVKLLQAFRSSILNAVVMGAYRLHKTSIEEKPKDKQRRNAFILYYIVIINQLFFVSFLRALFALLWGFYSFVVGILMRPLWANVFLFGRFTGLEHRPIEIDIPNLGVKFLDFTQVQTSLKKIQDANVK